jgi:uncharacterized membrane protein YdfJ with MMPL/SSD domain
VFARLARLVHARPRLVVLAASVLAVIAVVFGYSVADRLDPLGFDDPDSQSIRTNAMLAEQGWHEVGLVVLVDPGTRGSDAQRARVATIAAEIRQDADVTGVSPVSRDSAGAGRTYLMVTLRPTDDMHQQEVAERFEERFGGSPGVSIGGPAAAFAQLNQTIQHDLQIAELYAFLFVLTLLFFRSLVAAALPLLVGGLSVVMTMFALRIISDFMGISVLSLNLVTALGLGLAIDYSLFMVSRYREELARHGPGVAALHATLATAGRTVLFSALTVAATVAALLVFPQQFLYSISIGGILVSLLAAGTSLLVLPAVLALLGHRVNALAPRRLRRRADRDALPVTAGVWYRLAMLVMRRPGIIALATGAVLLAMAVPFLGIRFTSLDASVLPQSTGARQVYESLRADGMLARSTPLVVVMRGADQSEAQAFTRQLGRLPDAGVVSPATPLRRGDLVTQVVVDAPVFSPAAEELVKAVRTAPAPFPVSVTGPTAEFVDLKTSTRDHLPPVALVIVISTMIALFLMTGSIVLGIKTLVMNMLTLGAVFGVLVVVFQDGRFESFLGYAGQGALESTMPLILFAGVFGLSTDYGVFLIARIKEARDDGTPDRRAVAVGQAQTGRLITSAALLFCIAVGSFGTARIVGIKEMTLGIALGVLLDATIVRIFLVPALMQLLNRWNWWSPRPLTWLYRRIGLAETALPTRAPNAVASAPHER